MKLVILGALLMVLSDILYAQLHTDTIVIFFEIDSSVVDEKNANPLDELFFGKSIISLSIYGYTDFLGSKTYNQKLSTKRSTNVYNYLIEKNFDGKKIISCEGKGVYPKNLEENSQNISDKGIRAHRIVQVIYISQIQEITFEEEVPNRNVGEDTSCTSKMQETILEKEISERNIVKNTLSEENLMVNNLIVLENITFHGGTSRFLPESYPSLRKLVKIMKNHRKMKIEIHGHICCVDFNWENESLSTSRAKAVYDFLRSNRIKSSRMAYKGFGATRRRFPLEQNEYERSMNRRVEIFILDM
ncbi:MAG: OmpA family protein [Tannerella sp.]|jgi:outer membrane protein OmpA-like peptidoglycan-associated protein|nr:OmpA family protein [Tannerella sp.]